METPVSTPMKVTVREDSDPDTEDDEDEDPRRRSRLRLDQTLQRVRSMGVSPDQGRGEAMFKGRVRSSLRRVVRRTRRLSASGERTVSGSPSNSSVRSMNSRDASTAPGATSPPLSPVSPSQESGTSRSPFAEEAQSRQEERSKNQTYTMLRSSGRQRWSEKEKRSQTEVFSRPRASSLTTQPSQALSSAPSKRFNPKRTAAKTETQRTLPRRLSNRFSSSIEGGDARGGTNNKAKTAIDDALEQAKAYVKIAGLRQWSIKHRDGTLENVDAGGGAESRASQAAFRNTRKALIAEENAGGAENAASRTTINKRSKWMSVRKAIGSAMSTKPTASKTLADVVDDPGDGMYVNYLMDSDSDDSGSEGGRLGSVTSNEDIPETRVKGDVESWMYRKFGKAMMFSLRMLDRLERLTPGEKRISSKLQAAVSLSKSDGNVPIHIQLLQIGGDPAAEQRGAGRGGDLLRPPWQPLSVMRSPLQNAMLGEGMLEGRQLYFHLLTTSERVGNDAGAVVARDEYVTVFVNGQRQRTQTKYGAVMPHWGETFVYTPQELHAGDWTVLVQVWDTKGRFLGDAEIDLRDYAAEILSEKCTAVVHAANLYAINRAGRQVTGRVRFALWTCAEAWWDVSWGGNKPPAQPLEPTGAADAAEATPSAPTCSTWLPPHLPRPLPSVLHLPNAVVYEEPLITFLYIKFIKLRARKGPANAGRRGSQAWVPALTQSGSLRGRTLSGTNSGGRAAQFDRLIRPRRTAGHARINSLGSYEETTVSASDLEDWDALEASQHDGGPLASGKSVRHARGGSVRDGAPLGLGGAGEEQRFEFKVVFRGIERRHRFRGLPDLSGFASLDAAMYFPIRDQLGEGEVLTITVKRGRRIVVETSITVQAILSSCARLGNQKEDEIWWNLDGKWPGSAAASGEVLLNYGVTNCDYRGGLVASEEDAGGELNASVSGQRALNKLNSRQPRSRGTTVPAAAPAPYSRMSAFQGRASRMSYNFGAQATRRLSTVFGSFFGALPADEPLAADGRPASGGSAGVFGSGATKEGGVERGPMGYCKIVLHGLRLAAPQEHICILRASNYWVRASPGRTREGGSSWRDVVVVLPLWTPSEHIVLGAFSNSGALRSSVNLIGKLRFRISSLRAGQQLTYARFPLASETGSSSPGFAMMSVEWTYTSIPAVLQSYFKPRHPDALFELGIPSLVKDMEREVNQINMEWLDSCADPPIPLTVARKALATSRDNFELKAAQANFKRIVSIVDKIKAASAAFAKLQAWDNQVHSVGALLGVVLFVFYPATVAALLCVAIGVSSMSSKPEQAGGSGAGEAGGESERGVEGGGGGGGGGEKEGEKKEGEVALSWREKYNKLIEYALTVQNIMDDIAGGAERLQSLTNWRDPTSTLLVCTVLFAAAPLLCLLGLRVVLLFALCWQLRPPSMRDPITPAPLVFFSHLPTMGHSLQATDIQGPD